MLPSIFLTVAFAIAVSALPQATPACAHQCCKSVDTAANNPAIKPISGLLGASIPSDNTPIGITCTLYKAPCAGKSVCCTNNNFGGVIAIGCTPA